MRYAENKESTVAWIATTINRQTADTILELQNQGLSQVVFRNKASESTGRLRNAAVNVDWLPMELARRNLAVSRLKSWLDDHPKVILHTLGVEATLIASFVRRQHNARVVAEVTGRDPKWWWHRLIRTGYFSRNNTRLIIREPGDMAAFAPGGRYDSVPADRVRFIPYGVSVQQYAHSENNAENSCEMPFVIGTCIDSVSNKKLRALLRLFERTVNTAQFEIRLIGDDAAIDKAMSLTRAPSSNLGSTIRFVTCGTDSPKQWCGCTISYHHRHGRREGENILDAMACGAIPIAGDQNDFGPIKNGINGFFVKPDDAGAFGQIVQFLYQSRDTRAELAATARRTILESYELSTTTRQLREVYRDSSMESHAVQPAVRPRRKIRSSAAKDYAAPAVKQWLGGNSARGLSRVQR